MNELLSWFESLIAKETDSSYCEDGSLHTRNHWKRIKKGENEKEGKDKHPELALPPIKQLEAASIFYLEFSCPIAKQQGPGSRAAAT